VHCALILIWTWTLTPGSSASVLVSPRQSWLGEIERGRGWGVLPRVVLRPLRIILVGLEVTVAGGSMGRWHCRRRSSFLSLYPRPATTSGACSVEWRGRKLDRSDSSSLRLTAVGGWITTVHAGSRRFMLDHDGSRWITTGHGRSWWFTMDHCVKAYVSDFVRYGPSYRSANAGVLW
jgi:hypothetical protein